MREGEGMRERVCVSESDAKGDSNTVKHNTAHNRHVGLGSNFEIDLHVRK